MPSCLIQQLHVSGNTASGGVIIVSIRIVIQRFKDLLELESVQLRNHVVHDSHELHKNSKARCK